MFAPIHLTQCMAEVIRVWWFLWTVALVSIVGCIRIDRKSFLGTNTVSLFPATPFAGFADVKALSQLVYVPCPFQAEEPISPLDDDHFCSILCERGHVVHYVDSTGFGNQALTSVAALLAQLLDHICNETPITLVGNELSTLYLLKMVSQMDIVHYKLSRVLHRVILIDPPPLHSLTSETGRRHILQRYFPSIATLPLPSLADSVIPLPVDAVDHATLQHELSIYDQESRRSARILPVTLKATRRKRSSNYITLTGTTNAASVAASRYKSTVGAQQSSVFAALSRGELSTTDLIGSDLPARAADIVRVLGPGSVRVSQSGGLNAKLRPIHRPTTECEMHALSSVENIQRINNAIHNDEPLAEEDKWGAAAVQEAAAIYGALPVYTDSSCDSALSVLCSHDAEMKRHAYIARIIADIMP